MVDKYIDMMFSCIIFNINYKNISLYIYIYIFFFDFYIYTFWEVCFSQNVA